MDHLKRISILVVVALLLSVVYFSVMAANPPEDINVLVQSVYAHVAEPDRSQLTHELTFQNGRYLIPYWNVEWQHPKIVSPDPMAISWNVESMLAFPQTANAIRGAFESYGIQMLPGYIAEYTAKAYVPLLPPIGPPWPDKGPNAFYDNGVRQNRKVEENEIYQDETGMYRAEKHTRFFFGIGSYYVWQKVL